MLLTLEIIRPVFGIISLLIIIVDRAVKGNERISTLGVKTRL